TTELIAVDSLPQLLGNATLPPLVCSFRNACTPRSFICPLPEPETAKLLRIPSRRPLAKASVGPRPDTRGKSPRRAPGCPLNRWLGWNDEAAVSASVQIEVSTCGGVIHIIRVNHDQSEV